MASMFSIVNYVRGLSARNFVADRVNRDACKRLNASSK